tara:strand:+ start:1813 stop:2181 length:369 start_codon:yes stop_codon:yes gene_type:complete
MDYLTGGLIALFYCTFSENSLTGGGKQGTKSKNKYIDIQKIAEMLDEVVKIIFNEFGGKQHALMKRFSKEGNTEKAKKYARELDNILHTVTNNKDTKKRYKKLLKIRKELQSELQLKINHNK